MLSVQEHYKRRLCFLWKGFYVPAFLDTRWLHTHIQSSSSAKHLCSFVVFSVLCPEICPLFNLLLTLSNVFVVIVQIQGDGAQPLDLWDVGNMNMTKDLIDAIHIMNLWPKLGFITAICFWDFYNKTWANMGKISRRSSKAMIVHLKMRHAQRWKLEPSCDERWAVTDVKQCQKFLGINSGCDGLFLPLQSCQLTNQ